MNRALPPIVLMIRSILGLPDDEDAFSDVEVVFEPVTRLSGLQRPRLQGFRAEIRDILAEMNSVKVDPIIAKICFVS